MPQENTSIGLGSLAGDLFWEALGNVTALVRYLRSPDLSTRFSSDVAALVREDVGVVWVRSLAQFFTDRVGTRGQKMVESWSMLLSDAREQADGFFDAFCDDLLSREAPGILESGIQKRLLRDELLFSRRRRFLVIRTKGPAKLFRICVGVRPWGKELQINYYIILAPGIFRRFWSWLLTLPQPDRFALWESLSTFKHQDLHAYASLVHSQLKQRIQQTMEELGQDFGRVNTKTKGILELW